MKSLVFITVAVFSTVPAAASAGEPVPEKARKLAEHGRVMHDKGDYARAIVAFKEAYVIAPSAGLLFNLAQAYRLQGNCDDASLMYRRYLGTATAPAGRALAEAHLATMERCVQQRALNIPMDDSMAYLAVTAPPGPEQHLVDMPSASAAPGKLKQNIGIGVTLAGTAALAIAAYYAFEAHAASDRVSNAYAQGARWEAVADIHARGQRTARYATGFGIGGGLAIATGVTLFVLGKRAEQAAPIAVVPMRGGAEVSLAWRF